MYANNRSVHVTPTVFGPHIEIILLSPVSVSNQLQFLLQVVERALKLDFSFHIMMYYIYTNRILLQAIHFQRNYT